MDDDRGRPRPDEGGPALSRRSDFRLGNATIRPSLRTVEGPGGSATVEPQVMQVMLSLIEADGAVLSREDLHRLCWPGRIVGDDAVNRTIAAVRRITSETQAGFGIETIPRVGYRLTVENGAAESETLEPREAVASDAKSERSRLPRRAILAGAVGLTGLAGLGAWLLAGPGNEAKFSSEFVTMRDAVLANSDRNRTVARLRQFAETYPKRAEAWGLLSYAEYSYAEVAPPSETNRAVHASERSAQRALAIEPRESYALLTQALLRSGLDDWIDTERRLRRVIGFDPQSVLALEALVLLLQSVGRCRESRDLLESAIAIEPMLPALQFKRALKFWIFGDVRKADLAIDRARQLWPANEWVWNARLMIYAFTGRPLAALALVDDEKGRPALLSEVTAQLWRTALRALHSRARSDIAGARELILHSAPKGPANAGNGVMLLSTLGEVDAAFAVAESLLLRRGRYIDDPKVSDDARLIDSEGWRRTQWLFTPATNAFRADPRFPQLCADLGLTGYWRRSKVWPDAFVRGALQPTTA